MQNKVIQEADGKWYIVEPIPLVLDVEAYEAGDQSVVRWIAVEHVGGPYDTECDAISVRDSLFKKN